MITKINQSAIRTDLQDSNKTINFALQTGITSCQKYFCNFFLLPGDDHTWTWPGPLWGCPAPRLLRSNSRCRISSGSSPRPDWTH